MSTATADKAVSPLGSFITKLTPTAPVEKAAIKPVAETVKSEDAAVKVEPVTRENPAEAKATPVTKAEDAPKESESDITEKRLKDTQKWGNEERKARLAAEQKAIDLQARLERIEKKLDGTYEEPTAPSAAQASAEADVKGRIRASHRSAVRQYGEEYVLQTVWAQDSPYMELQARDPQIRARVMAADDPVLEAIACVKEQADAEKYGRTPDEIRKKIEAELAPRLKQEIMEGLKPKPGPVTNTLGNVRGNAERTEQKSDAPSALDLRRVFPWGASRT